MDDQQWIGGELHGQYEDECVYRRVRRSCGMVYRLAKSTGDRALAYLEFERDKNIIIRMWTRAFFFLNSR